MWQPVLLSGPQMSLVCLSLCELYLKLAFPISSVNSSDVNWSVDSI